MKEWQTNMSYQKKTNYMGQFLSPKSREIIENINKKYELRDLHNSRQAKGRTSKRR